MKHCTRHRWYKAKDFTADEARRRNELWYAVVRLRQLHCKCCGYSPIPVGRGTEIEKVVRDAVGNGIGVMFSGKRVKYEDYFKDPMSTVETKGE